MEQVVDHVYRVGSMNELHDVKKLLGMVGIGKYLTSFSIHEGDCLHSCMLPYVWLSGDDVQGRVEHKQNV
jgi:hypothetical protein